MMPSKNRNAMPEISPLTYLLFISHLLHIISKDEKRALINPHMTVKVVYFAISPSSETIKISVNPSLSALKMEIITTAETIIRIPRIYTQVTFSPIQQYDSITTMKQLQIMTLVPRP